MKAIHPVALFRYSVLGPLVSRVELARGELKATLQELAARHYDIPGSRNTRLSGRARRRRAPSTRGSRADSWAQPCRV
jgi:hypothetical protein